MVICEFNITIVYSVDFYKVNVVCSITRPIQAYVNMVSYKTDIL